MNVIIVNIFILFKNLSFNDRGSDCDFNFVSSRHFCMMVKFLYLYNLMVNSYSIKHLTFQNCKKTKTFLRFVQLAHYKQKCAYYNIINVAIDKKFDIRLIEFLHQLSVCMKHYFSLFFWHKTEK